MIPALLVAGAALMCGKPQDTTLVGMWEAYEPGVLFGDTIEFRSDGTFVQAAMVSSDSVYHLDGEYLITGPPDRVPLECDPGPPSLTITPRVLTERNADGSSIIMERVGEPPIGPATIVGVWRYRHYTGGIAFERYTTDGKVLFRQPLFSSTGCFVIRGSTIVLTTPDEPEVVTDYALTPTELTVFDPAGETRTYRKSPYGPWYDREHIDYVEPKPAEVVPLH